MLIAAADMVDDSRVITGRPVTIAAAFAEEQPAMLSLPAEPFGPSRLLQARMDSAAWVCVQQNHYSVPAVTRACACRCGRRPPPSRCSTGPQVVAGYECMAGKYAEILVLDQPMEVLRYETGAALGDRAGPGPGGWRVHHRPPAVFHLPASGHGHRRPQGSRRREP
jgi:hypothetical protein